MTVHTHGDMLSVASLLDQATSTMTRYPTQSHYLNTKQTRPCPILAVLSSTLSADKYQFKSTSVQNIQANSGKYCCIMVLIRNLL